MTARKVRRRRFRILDELGLMEIVRMYLEECRSVRQLCQHIFGPAHDGRRVGTSLFYEWLDDRKLRHEWESAISFRRQLLEKE
jgi:hypothetical protein